ncbi:MAG: HYC_CC_PP family protein [Adhaeribacter sp.]
MKLYRRIILLTLTLLLLVSSTGISVGLHICGDKVQDLTFFGRQASCPMEEKQQQAPPCHQTKDTKPGKQDCCQQHQLSVSPLEEAARHQPQALVKAADLKILAAVQVFLQHLLAPATTASPAYALYTSPPIARDIPVLVQSFLL